MATSNPVQRLLSSIASLSPPLSLKSGTLDLPNDSDSLRLEINPAPEPTLTVIPSTTQISTVYAQPLSSTPKTRHSPTPPPNNLQITINNHPIPPKKKYNILEDPAFIDSGITTPPHPSSCVNSLPNQYHV